MTAYILHQGASVMCQHSGQASPMQVNPRVKVSGNPIVTQTSIYTISTCPLSNGRCLTAQWLRAATRVRSNQQFVVLQDSQSLVNNGTPLQVLSTQTRVKAV